MKIGYKQDMTFEKNITTFSIGTTVSYVGLSILQSSYIALFFNTGTNANYAILFYPNCENYSLSVYINKSNGRAYSYFSYHIGKGLGEATTPTKIKIIEFDSSNDELTFYTSKTSSSKISLNQSYDASSIYFSTGTIPGTFLYKFIPVNAANGGIRQCNLTIEVKECYPGCGSCNEYGTSDDAMFNV